MRGNMGALLKQAARVQENIKRLQHELEHLEVTGSASVRSYNAITSSKNARFSLSEKSSEPI